MFLKISESISVIFMLEITQEHINALSDSDFRILIGFLCEAELRANGYSSSHVTWGGKQTASDGGSDVRVKRPASQKIYNGYISNSNTIIQVKKSSMTPSKIQMEMCPNGKIRSIIEELSITNGTYIIASSESTTDSMLQNRKNKMTNIIVKSGLNVSVDYLDLQRITSWAREHPAIIVWIRERIKQPLFGWRAYGNWSATTSNNTEYLLDNKARIKYNGHILSIQEGINLLREKLVAPKTSLRLTGLSGLGKTRLVEALFDDRVGIYALNKSIVVYTDLGYSPTPTPQQMVEYLLTLNTTIIVVIDNCLPELHRTLTKSCRSTQSQLSLITIEYDIKEDQPDETDVFQLEAASDELIQKILDQNFPDKDLITLKRMSKFAGGNARIAIALANSIERGDDILKLSDQELFDRLFWQRGEKNDDFLKIAEVCSLVYSFSIEENRHTENEALILCKLVDIPLMSFYRYIQELIRKGLMQHRSRWRAVLPHAIAIRLALKAINDYPIEIIVSFFYNHPRLMLSFCHRLGFLSSSKSAIEAAQHILNQKKVINLFSLSQNETKMLIYLAPVIPDAILKLIDEEINIRLENFLSDYFDFHQYLRVLHEIAYDPKKFDTCVNLLIRCSLVKDKNYNQQIRQKYLSPLFRLHGSGTHVPLSQCINIIDPLLHSTIDTEYELGSYLLENLLNEKALYFPPENSCDFLNRKYGYLPENKADYLEWYSFVFNYMISICKFNTKLNRLVQKLFASKFTVLWNFSILQNILITYAHRIRHNNFWPEGYIKISFILHYMNLHDEDRNIRYSKEKFQLIEELKNYLAPQNEVETFILYLCSSEYDLRNINISLDTTQGCISHLEHLGQSISSQREIIQKILPLCCTQGNWFSYFLGRGLAYGAYDLENMWELFIIELQNTDQKYHSNTVLCGFINAMDTINLSMCRKELRKIRDNKLLCQLYPVLLNAVSPENSFDLIMDAILFSDVPSESYNNINLDSWSTDQISNLCLSLAKKDKNSILALDIFFTKYYQDIMNKKIAKPVCLLGHELLMFFDFSQDNDIKNRDYKLSHIIEACYSSHSLKESFRLFLLYIHTLVASDSFYIGPFDFLSKTLITIDTNLFLDVFLSDNTLIPPIRNFMRAIYEKNVLNESLNQQIIIWCKKNPNIRFYKVAQVITPFKYLDRQLIWTDLALNILNTVQDISQVLEYYVKSFEPAIWSGSRADLMKDGSRLLQQLFTHPNDNIASQSSFHYKELLKKIEYTREWEKNLHKGEERFE